MILEGTGWNIFAPWHIISVFEKVIRGVKFRTSIISCHRIQSTRKRTKIERKNLKKILSYPSEKKWHLQATELCFNAGFNAFFLRGRRARLGRNQN